MLEAKNPNSVSLGWISQLLLPAPSRSELPPEALREHVPFLFQEGGGCQHGLACLPHSSLQGSLHSVLTSPSHLSIIKLPSASFLHPKGNQPWTFIGRADAEAETPNTLADSLEKIPMLGKTEGKRRGGRGWGGWMASPSQWTCVCTNFGS